MSYNSKYTGQEVEQLLDQVKNGSAGGEGGGITSETDPIFSASPAASITEGNIASWNNKANTSDIPTDMSQLNDDVGFLTGESAGEEVDDINPSSGGVSITEISEPPTDNPTDDTIMVDSTNNVGYLGLKDKGWWTFTLTPFSMDNGDPGSFKVLFVGNSYSEDTCAFMHQIATAVGCRDIDISFLFIASSTIDVHWTNAQGNKASYLYCKVTSTPDGEKLNSIQTISSAKTIKDAVGEQPWNWIVLQQGSKLSGQQSSYSNLQNLIDYIKGYLTSKVTKFAFNMTWAYKTGYSGLSSYNNSQETMYASICSAVQAQVLTNSNIERIIPAGTAIQNVRNLVPFADEFTADGTHLSANGSFIAGLTCVLTLFNGTDSIPAAQNYKPNVCVPRDAVINTRHDYTSTFDNEHIYDYVDAALKAIATPYSVTASDYMADTGFYNSIELCPADEQALKTLTFPQSEFVNLKGSKIDTAESIAERYLSTRLFTPTTLPVGSTVAIKSGYQFRPESWPSYDEYPSARGDNLKTTLTIDDAFWTGKAYVGFNISRTTSTTTNLSATELSDIRNNTVLQITKGY